MPTLADVVRITKKGEETTGFDLWSFQQNAVASGTLTPDDVDDPTAVERVRDYLRAISNQALSNPKYRIPMRKQGFGRVCGPTLKHLIEEERAIREHLRQFCHPTQGGGFVAYDDHEKWWLFVEPLAVGDELFFKRGDRMPGSWGIA